MFIVFTHNLLNVDARAVLFVGYFIPLNSGLVFLGLHPIKFLSAQGIPLLDLNHL